MNHKLNTVLPIVQKIVGATDLLTGLLLICAPTTTLKLMMITTCYVDTGLLSFIGTFVFAIGLSYFLVPKSPRDISDVCQWIMQWKITAIARLCVGTFITYQLFFQGWHIGWVSVALSDLAYAGIQFYGIKKQWLTKMIATDET